MNTRGKPFVRAWVLPKVLILLQYYHIHLGEKIKPFICHALSGLVPFVQFKKSEKHSSRSVNFIEVAGFSLQLY